MSDDQLFSICNFGVIPVWLLLAVAPRWKVTHLIANSAAVSLLIAVVYAFAIGTSLGQAEGSMNTLDGIQLLFTNKRLALAGWLHYLAFDLFIGSWECRNAQRLGISHWYVVPCMFFTLMLGPVGLLLYFIVRWFHGQWLVPADGSAG